MVFSLENFVLLHLYWLETPSKITHSDTLMASLTTTRSVWLLTSKFRICSLVLRYKSSGGSVGHQFKESKVIHVNSKQQYYLFT